MRFSTKEKIILSDVGLSFFFLWQSDYMVLPAKLSYIVVPTLSEFVYLYRWMDEFGILLYKKLRLGMPINYLMKICT